MTLLHAHFHLRNLQAFKRLLQDGQHSSFESATTGQLSTSAPKSSPRLTHLHPTSGGGQNLPHTEVNALDWLGRTTLHLACAASDGVEYVRLLLRHPHIDVNIPDKESGWTALHRAFYHGNVEATTLLLQRSNLDVSAKDYDGYTAYELYSLTVDFVQPNPAEPRANLYTWGANRNAALAVGDSDDRLYPDTVPIPRKDKDVSLARDSLQTRLSPIHVEQVRMSRLHTAVVTSEEQGNLRVSGIGTGGRLGTSNEHTQYSLVHVPSLTHQIVSVAVGQDHTLAVTASGEVLSWGLNRFSQLGYVIENSRSPVAILSKQTKTTLLPCGPAPSVAPQNDELVQHTPRKVQGLLKKEEVCGVAASRGSSAAWSSLSLWTWGTNWGQLGYEKVAQPVQVLPRKVSRIDEQIVDVALSDSAMVCLLGTCNLICFSNDRNFKIHFSVTDVPRNPFRAPFELTKIVSGEGGWFAVLSSSGDVYTFSAPNLTATGNAAGEASRSLDATRDNAKWFQPQRTWASSHSLNKVRDVSLGSEGTIIVCTNSGHVFVRTSSPQTHHQQGESRGGKIRGFRFHRVPYLQRAVQVCANGTGAFAAVTVECDVSMSPDLLPKDDLTRCYSAIRPWARRQHPNRRWHSEEEADEEEELLPTALTGLYDPDEDADEHDSEIDTDVIHLFQLCSYLELRSPVATSTDFCHGADMVVEIQPSGHSIPVHSALLFARLEILDSVVRSDAVLQDILSSRHITSCRNSVQPPLKTTRSPAKSLRFSGFHPLSVLILLHYVYTDNWLALHDRGVYEALFKLRENTTKKQKDRHEVVEHKRKKRKLDLGFVVEELRILVKLLRMTALEEVLKVPVKRAVAPSLVNDLQTLMCGNDGQTHSQHVPGKNGGSVLALKLLTPSAPDVVLHLADRDIRCYSFILRARSPFFADFFDDEDWTKNRWDEGGFIEMDFRHLRWNGFRYVLQWMVSGGGGGLFDHLDSVVTVSDLLELMFEVVAAANELLLQDVIEICSSVILNHVNIYNACYILTEATLYHATTLMQHTQSFMAANIESLLEHNLLSDLPSFLIEQLESFIRKKQSQYNPIARNRDRLLAPLMERWSDWLKMQDLPVPIVSTSHRNRPKALPSSPKSANSGTCGVSKSGIALALDAGGRGVDEAEKNQRVQEGDDDVFLMDESPAVPEVPRASVRPGIREGSSWKVWNGVSAPLPRSDMKSIMAEAQAAAAISTRPIRVSPMNTSKSAAISGKSKAPWPPSQVENTPPPSSQPVSVSNAVNKPRQPPSPPLSASVNTPPRPVQGQTAAYPGLGPVFTPTKQTGGKASLISSGRRTSGNKAWSQFPELPPLPPTSPSASLTPLPPVSSTSDRESPVNLSGASPSNASRINAKARGGKNTLSLVAIQQLELDRMREDPARDGKKKSLLEIQEEEAARREEAEFLKWWEEEEERVKWEARAVEESQAAAPAGVTAGGGGGSGSSPGMRSGRGSRGKSRGGVMNGGRGGGARKNDRGVPQPAVESGRIPQKGRTVS